MLQGFANRWVVAAVMIAAAVGGSLPAWPQESTDAAADLTARAEKLLEEFGADRKLAQRLRADAEAAEETEQRILRRRLSETSLEMLDDLGSLVEAVLELQRSGADVSALRDRLAPIMEELADNAPGVAQQQRERLKALREKAKDAAPEDLETLEEQYNKESAWLDTIRRACVDHLDRMNSLELETAEFGEWLKEALTRGADQLAGQLEIASEDLAALRSRSADSPDDAMLHARARIAEVRQEGAATGLAENVALMKRMKLETTSYQQVLIQATGEITTDVLDTRVAMGLLQDWTKSVKDWLLRMGPEFLLRALVFVLVIGVFWLIARIVRRIVLRSVTNSRLEMSQLMRDMVVSFSSRVVLFLGLLLALSQVGFSLGPLLAGLGVAGFILGFALQDALANFASGMMILVYRPFDVGDVIEAGGVSGKVNHMTLVSTTILTFDNQTLIVPNNKIWGDVIKNVTAQTSRRVDLVFGISYSDDIPKTERILGEIATAHPKVLDDPAPVVKLHNLNDSSVDFVVRPWCKTDDYWDVYWDITREVKQRFDAEGISIPFPQRDVHVHREQSQGGGKSEAA